jgi:Tol biopolymer transport system component
MYTYWYHPGPLAIYIMDPDGKNRELLFTGSSDSFDYPQWLPNGKEIIFSCNKDQMWDLFIVDVNSSEVTNLTNGIGNNHLYFNR